MPDGLREDTRIDRLIFTAALSRSPLPQDALDAFERARKLAISSAPAGFRRMSVGLQRRPPEAKWHFRFYDDEDIVARVTVTGDGYRETEL